MPEHSFDIAVVGAGPAGAMAAKSAAERGRSVVLFERKQSVGMPVRCGEGVGLKGVSASTELRKEWIKATISKVTLYSPSGYEVSIDQIGDSFILDRARMDSDLVTDAIAAGAQYLPGTPVLSIHKSEDSSWILHTGSKSYKAPCIIAADGVESSIAHYAGIDSTLKMKDICTCAFARIESRNIDQETIALYYGKNIAPGGYLWIFPRGGFTANVGLGILGTESSSGKARHLLTTFIQKHFPDTSIADFHCGGVPVGPWLKPLAKNGVLVAGDAAHQVNAVNGGGIAYAMIAGNMAGETAAEAFTDSGFNQACLRNYEKKWARFHGKQQLRSYALKNMLIRFDDATMDNIAQSVKRKKNGEINYVSVFKAALIKNPFLLFRAYKLFKP